MITRKVITFYSYKGGVGRTFALANVAVVLARWGYRVLCMDWDIEAPGLSDYFQPLMQGKPIRSGLIDWLERADNESAEWLNHIHEVHIPPNPSENQSASAKAATFDFIPVGKQDARYVDRIQSLNWGELYEQHQLGQRLEDLREELTSAYDFILIDSRTGISDSGGICTIQLPDVLVFLFTANGQSLRGVTSAVRGARESQRNLPYDRAPLLTLPVLSRFDGKEEHQRGQHWLNEIAKALPEFYTQWVDAPPILESSAPPDPQSLVDVPRLLSLTTLPYVPYWSFGEELAVTTENPSFSHLISHHIETLAALLAHKLSKTSLLLDSRQKYVEAAKAPEPDAPAFKYECFIASDFRSNKQAGALAKALVEQNIPVWHESLHLDPGSKLSALQDALRQSRHFVVLAGPGIAMDRNIDQLTQQMARELVDHPGDRRLMPVVQTGVQGNLPVMIRDRVSLSCEGFESGALATLLRTHLSLAPAQGMKAPRMLDLPGDPEDKDFARMAAISGPNLAGVLGSPSFRHGAVIMTAVFSPDGRTAATGGMDGVVRLWDLDTGREIRAFLGHQGSVHACAFSPDGQRLLSGSNDNSLKLWDAVSGKEIRAFAGHQGSVRTCAFSPDSQRLLSGSSDHSLKLWDTATGKEIRAFKGHQDWVRTCAFSPDGQRLLSGSNDNSLKLWDAASGNEIRAFTGHQSSVHTCAFSPDGNRLISGSQDYSLKLWDTASGKEIRTFTGHQGSVWACAFSPDGQRLISGSLDKSLKLWDTASGKEISAFTGHRDWVRTCAFSPDGQRLLSGSNDNSLKLWDAATGNEIRTFTGHQGCVHACTFSPDGQRLISGSADQSLKLWDAASGNEIRAFKGHRDLVRTCAFSPDSQRLISGSEDNSLKLWDAASGKEILTITGHQGSVWACAFSPDGQRLISGSLDKSLKLWDTASGKEIRAFTGHQGWVLTCAFSPDGQRLISGSEDNSLKLWDTASGKEIRTFTGHQSYVYACAFSPDGQRLISGSLDTCLKLWDAASGKEIRAFKGHQASVNACAFSPDGQRLISGSLDKSLKLWDMQKGHCLCTWILPFPATSVSWVEGPAGLWPERQHARATQAVAVGLTNGTVLMFDLTDAP